MYNRTSLLECTIFLLLFFRAASQCPARILLDGIAELLQRKLMLFD